MEEQYLNIKTHPYCAEARLILIFARLLIPANVLRSATTTGQNIHLRRPQIFDRVWSNDTRQSKASSIIKRSTPQHFKRSKWRFPSKSWSSSSAARKSGLDLATFRQDLPRVRHRDLTFTMRSQAPQQRQARVKKLSRTAGQSVLREDQLDSTEYHSLQANYNVETGVEKSEEKARDRYTS